MTENQQKEQLKPTKEKTYNLKNDVIFQTFFARKGNEEFLIDFLNGLLKKNIKSIEIREEVNLERLSREEKGGRLDLQAKLEDGTIISIEMQLRNEYNIEERTTLYSGKVMSRETERGTGRNRTSASGNAEGNRLCRHQTFIYHGSEYPETI